MMSKNAYVPRFFLFVDDEFENIGTAVMAGSIKFHVAQSDLIHVEIGIDEGFLVPNRLGEIMTAGIDDAAAAAAGRVIQFIDGALFHQVGGIHGLGKVLIDVKDVAVTFDSNVLDRILPFGIVVGIRCQIEADALLIEGRPGQRHVIFPANEGSHGSPRRLDDRKIRRRNVRIGPDIAFGTGRVYLSGEGFQGAVGPENDVAAVERIRRFIALGDA